MPNTTKYYQCEIFNVILYYIFTGPLDPSKTGFVSQSTVVVATKGLIQSLVLEPRDEYGNMCAHTPETDSKNNYRLILKQVYVCFIQINEMY